MMEHLNCKNTRVAMRSFVTTLKQSLAASSTNDKAILTSFTSLNAVLMCQKCNALELEKWGLDDSVVDKDSIRTIFLSECYTDLGDFLLQQLNVEWLKRLAEQKSESLFKSYYLCGCRHQAFSLMCHYIHNSRYTV